jgi:hypothetical protein
MFETPALTVVLMHLDSSSYCSQPMQPPQKPLPRESLRRLRIIGLFTGAHWVSIKAQQMPLLTYKAALLVKMASIFCMVCHRCTSSKKNVPVDSEEGQLKVRPVMPDAPPVHRISTTRHRVQTKEAPENLNALWRHFASSSASISCLLKGLSGNGRVM